MVISERLGSYDYFKHATPLWLRSMKENACLVYDGNRIKVVSEREAEGLVLCRLEKGETESVGYAEDFVHQKIMSSVKRIVSDMWEQFNDTRTSMKQQQETKPHFGDKVFIDESGMYYKYGDWGVLDGSLDSDKFAITFRPSAYRTDITCHSSGGPATFYFPKSAFDLRPTGRKEWVTFWRFKGDVMRAGNSYDYQLLVWVWNWNERLWNERLWKNV